MEDIKELNELELDEVVGGGAKITYNSGATPLFKVGDNVKMTVSSLDVTYVVKKVLGSKAFNTSKVEGTMFVYEICAIDKTVGNHQSIKETFTKKIGEGMLRLA